MDNIILFHLLLFFIAFLYASVGHGGASGYLALMALWGLSPAFMKPTALLLNLFVSLTSFIQYYRGGHFDRKLFLPLALSSIPFSFLGGWLTLDTIWYKKILGILLLLPVLRFMLINPEEQTVEKKSDTTISVILGAGIGMLSGMIGIGGGILLSPILLLLGWAGMKKTAATSALFIFVNSLSGLGGQLLGGLTFEPEMFTLVLTAFTGGLLGAWMGARKFNERLLQYALSLVLLVASWKLLFAHT